MFRKRLNFDGLKGVPTANKLPNATGGMTFPRLKTETEVGYNKRTIYATPSGYDSNSAAVNAYKTVSGGPVHNAVSNIQISGPESKNVQTIWPCYPIFPLQCE